LCCGIGKLYPSESRKLLEFKGNAPIEVTKHEKEVLRCNACGREVMSNKRIDKWTNSARSSVVLHKVKGFPFYRLSKLQSLYQIPISSSTLWMQCKDLWEESGIYIYNELLEAASNCKVFYSDDTKARILEVMQMNKILPESERRGCNTTIIRTKTQEQNEIVLYLTDNKHCGENVGKLLEKRNASISKHYIKLMVDASSKNKPVVDEGLGSKVIIFNCLAHGREKFNKLRDSYPRECGYFLNEISQIYKHEEKSKNYCKRKQLRHRKQHSWQHVKNIYQKIEELFRGKQVEPNSELGKAMNYFIRNRKGITRAFKVKGTDIDNNIGERKLKEIILQRKNSLFFKSKSSALILSGLSSIVYTCAANGINAFEYLNWIQDNYKKIEKQAGEYTPWKYRQYINETELIAA
jgi:transposase